MVGKGMGGFRVRKLFHQKSLDGYHFARVNFLFGAKPATGKKPGFI